MHDYTPGTGIKDNAQLATWLGIIAFTFFFGTFVAANVYLRGWSPEVFNVDFAGKAGDLPYLNTLILLGSAVLALIAGQAFRKRMNGAFIVTLALATLLALAYAVLGGQLVLEMTGLGKAVWTAYLTVYGLHWLLGLFNFILLAVALVFAFAGKEQALKRLVPTGMSVWLYTAITGLAVFVITDVVSVSEFAEWCGTKLTGAFGK
ncbi:hypothetical protein JCM14720_20520 [Calditerricola yamamurae]